MDGVGVKTRWMWGDVTILARVNPLRWSKTQAIRKTIDDLKELSERKRPIRLWISSGMHTYYFDSVDDCLQQLDRMISSTSTDEAGTIIEAIARKCDKLSQQALPQRVKEATDKLRLALEEVKTLRDEQQVWEYDYRAGGELLHRFAAKGAEAEDPPEWAAGNLSLGKKGMLFKALYEPLEMRHQWSDLTCARMLNEDGLAPSDGDVDLRIECKGVNGDKANTKHLSLSTKAARFFEDLASENGAKIADAKIVQPPGREASSASSTSPNSGAVIANAKIVQPLGQNLSSASSMSPNAAASFSHPASNASTSAVTSFSHPVSQSYEPGLRVPPLAAASVATPSLSFIGPGSSAAATRVPPAAVASAAVPSSSFRGPGVPAAASFAGSIINTFCGKLQEGLPVDTVEISSITLDTTLNVTSIRDSLLEKNGLVFECLKSNVDANDIEPTRWCDARRMENVKKQRIRFSESTPSVIEDITRTDSRVSFTGRGVTPVSMELSLSMDTCENGTPFERLTLAWETARKDVPYSEYFQAQKRFVFTPHHSGGGVIFSQHVGVHRVGPLPDLSNGDDEVVEYITEELHQWEIRRLGTALERVLLEQPVELPSENSLPWAVVRHFAAAVPDGCTTELRDIRRIPFFVGLEIFANALGELDQSLPAYLLNNTRKFRSSRAPRTETMYRPWLRSEAEFHAPWKGYADDSAWMANLWAHQMLDFFVELFAFLLEGKDMKNSCKEAYQKTLYNHFNFFQRKGFETAMSRMPKREVVMSRLKGNASDEDLAQGMAELVRLGRPIVRLCNDIDKELDNLREAWKNGRRS